MTATMSGRFVCLEGIDGAGKTTAAAVVHDFLRRRQARVALLDKHGVAFPSAYVDEHMKRLHDLIWGHPGDDPYLLMGDWHWIHLQAAWYEAVSHCVVAPLLKSGTLVVTDTWTHKFLAKLALRPLDVDRARSLFDGVVKPDLVIRFDIDPVTAARRKGTFGISESGNHEGDVDLTGAGFVDYQRRVGQVLTQLGDAPSWVALDVNGLTVPQTAAAVVEIITDRFPESVPARTPRLR